MFDVPHLPPASPPCPATPEPLPPGPGGRPRRRIRPPQNIYVDRLPPLSTPAVVTTAPDPPPAPPDDPGLDEPAPRPSQMFQTEPNSMGLYKVFPHRPSRDPDDGISLDDLCQSPGLLVPPSPLPDTDNLLANLSAFFPFLNESVARLMCWFYGGSNQKSVGELDKLVNDVLLNDNFKLSELENFSAARENERLDSGFDLTDPKPTNPAITTTESAETGHMLAADGWEHKSVKIRLPAKRKKSGEKDAPEFEVKGVLLRPLLDVMTEAFQSPAFLEYHLTPFEHVWDPTHDCDSGSEPVLPPPSAKLPDIDWPSDIPDGHQRVYGELYTSPEMLKAHAALPPDPNLETVVAAFMFWSDSTHLANFGNASLWPLYTFFGNQSKYTRAKPTSHACHHQAYIPSVSHGLSEL